MPNHIMNRLEIIGSQKEVKEVVETFGEYIPAKLRRSLNNEIVCLNKDKGVGWFNEKTGVFSRRKKDDIVGLPDGWEMEILPAFTFFPDFNKVLPMPEDIKATIGEAGIFPSWYRWSIKNWGTKWNSYEHKQVDNNTYMFETAWSGVPQIIEAISKRFPNILFKYEFSDENTGYNTGIYEFKNGCIKEYIPEEESREAFELAFKHRPHYREDYKLVGDNYELIED